jgi:predicted RND superfamily exporter protein
MIRHRFWAVLVPLLGTLWLGSYIPALQSDNSPESFLLPDDPVRVEYDRFRDAFGQDDVTLLALRPPRVFDRSFLEQLRELHRELEREVPYLGEVLSLVNVRDTRGEGEVLRVDEFLAELPSDDAGLRALRERALGNPVYVDSLINREGRVTAIAIEMLTYLPPASEDEVLAGFAEAPVSDSTAARSRWLGERENRAHVDAIHEIVARYARAGLQIGIVGNAPATFYMSDRLLEDQMLLLPGVLVVNALVLALVFRRASAVVLPLLIVVASLVATVGSMVLLDVPSSASAQIIPALLACVAICDAVHILTIVYQRLAAGASRETAIADGLGHSGLAVLMTSLTTAGGLLSFRAADIGQVADVGIIAPIGILFALLYTITLLPGLLALLPLRSASGAGEKGLEHGRLARGLASVGDFATRRPGAVLAGTALLVAAAALGMTRLRFAQDSLAWFPAHDPMRVEVEQLDQDLRGTGTLEVIIDTQRENGLHEPETLRRIAAAGEWASGRTVARVPVGKALSVVAVSLKKHQALHENRPEFYVLPDDRELLAQELFLFENSGSDDLEELVDTPLRRARLTLTVPAIDGAAFSEFQREIALELREILGPELPFQLTGISALGARSFEVLNYSMARSYALALAVISPLMIILIGSLRRGLLAMLPNLLPLALTLGLMGWLDLPLDASSLLAGSIILGLAVDDTIHFMHKFQRYREQTGDVRASVRKTLLTTGSALLFTTLVLLAGFAVLQAAYMINLQQFSTIACFAALAAFLADVLVAPALLTLVR